MSRINSWDVSSTVPPTPQQVLAVPHTLEDRFTVPALCVALTHPEVADCTSNAGGLGVEALLAGQLERTWAPMPPEGGPHPVIKDVRLAGPGRIPEIHALQTEYSVCQVPRSQRRDGWLYDVSTPAGLRLSMEVDRRWWVGVDHDNRVVAAGAMGSSSRLGHLRQHYQLFPEYQARVDELLRNGGFLYYGSVAVDKSAQRHGVARALTQTILPRYRAVPIACHVAVFDQADLDQAEGDLRSMQPAVFNHASHRFFQRLGFRLVGYISNVGGYSTGMPNEGRRSICGALYVRFPDDHEPREYVDPLVMIRNHPYQFDGPPETHLPGLKPKSERDPDSPLPFVLATSEVEPSEPTLEDKIRLHGLERAVALTIKRERELRDQFFIS